MLILERWDELPQPLVDWENPANSLIVQHALPRSEARFPHPEVPSWKPVFKPGNQRLLRDSLQWIEAMYRPRPAIRSSTRSARDRGSRAPRAPFTRCRSTDRQGR